MTPRARGISAALRLEVVFRTVAAATTLGAQVVGPRLDEACAGTLGTWWFLRQGKRWHLHLDGVERARILVVLNRLVETRVLRAWSTVPDCVPTPGGPTTRPATVGVACDWVTPGAGLDLQCVDSRGALAHLRRADRLPKNERPLLRTGHILGVLARAVCRSGGLDDPAAAEVLDTLARRHAGGLDESARVRAHGLSEVLILLWRAPEPRVLDGATAPWAMDLEVAMQDLATAARVTGLPPTDRSAYLRSQVGLVLAAQWDRVSLTPADQTILAVAIRDALRRRAS